MINNKNDLLVPLYDSLNWSGPEPIRCEGCKSISNIVWPPSSGSHPSNLSHYESILGALNEQRTRARILILLQDPRSGENNFTLADPKADPATLTQDEHRYFCLTLSAWRNLGLEQATNSVQPCWPTPDTAPRYLDRYMSRNKSWSYDGFLAYFLYLFRPESAIITNLAKCYFEKSQGGGVFERRRVFERCTNIHLEKEASLIGPTPPNLLISFTSQCDDGILRKFAPSLRSVTRLKLYHPASDRYGKTPLIKCQRFLEEVDSQATALEKLGYNVPQLQERWINDAL